MKTKSRLVAKGFSQATGANYNETTYLKPAAPPVKMIAAVANEKDFPAYHLDVSQEFRQDRIREEIFARLPPGCGELSEKKCDFRSVSTILSRLVGSGTCCW